MRLIIALAAFVFSLSAAAQEPGANYEPMINKYHSNTEYLNLDFTGKDWKACKATCEADSRCAAFSHFIPSDGVGSRCALRNGTGWGVKEAYNMVSGLRETPFPELTPEQAFAKSERMKRSTEEVIDLYAPRIKPRKLTAAERAEAKALLAKIKADSTWDNVEKLMVLAESGDKEMMTDFLEALNTGIWFTPWESWGAFGAGYGIRARWAAEYWTRHGPHPIAMNFLLNGTPDYDGDPIESGVTMTASNGKRVKDPHLYIDGRTKRAPKLKLTVSNAYKGEAALREKYDRLIAARQEGTARGPRAKDWTEAYAKAYPEVAGSLALAKSAEEQRVIDEENARLVRVMLMRENNQRIWNQLSEKSELTDNELLNLEFAAGFLGDDYLLAYAGRYPVQLDGSAKRVCALGHASCSAALAAKEARRAEWEAKQAADAMAVAAKARAGDAVMAAAINSSPFVEVRTYDRSGNFVGTRTMTKTQAEIIGATPD
jgi:hypothetical protein